VRVPALVDKFWSVNSMKDIPEPVPVTVEATQCQAEAPARLAPALPPDEEDRFTLRTLKTRAEIEGIQRALGHRREPQSGRPVA
jgi:hypothetical protein